MQTTPDTIDPSLLTPAWPCGPLADVDPTRPLGPCASGQAWAERLFANRVVRTAAIAALPWAVIAAAGCQSMTSSSMANATYQSTPAKSSRVAAAERTLSIADTYAKQGQHERAGQLYARVLRGDRSNRRATAGLLKSNPTLAAKLSDPAVLSDLAGQQSMQLADLSGAAAPAKSSTLFASVAETQAAERTRVPRPASSSGAKRAVASDVPFRAGKPDQSAFASPTGSSPTTVAATRPSTEAAQPLDLTPPTATVAAAVANADASPIIQTRGLVDDSLPVATFADAFSDAPIVTAEAVVEQPAPAAKTSDDSLPQEPVAFGEPVDVSTADVVSEPATSPVASASAEPTSEVSPTEPTTLQPLVAADNSTAQDADYFVAVAFDDGELSRDIGSTLADEFADAAPLQESLVAPDDAPSSDVVNAAAEGTPSSWVTTAEATGTMPQIRPATRPGQVEDGEATVAEADAVPAITWSLADEELDLTPVDAAGWAAAPTGEQASGKQIATVPQLTALVSAEDVTTGELLTAQAACDSTSDEVRLAAAEAVLTHRPHDRTAWGTVDSLLASDAVRIRTLATLMLGSLPADCHPRTMPRLLKQLSADDLDVRSASALALGGLGKSAQPAVPKLRELAQAGGTCSESAQIALDCLELTF